jgi:hypothetical protein
MSAPISSLSFAFIAVLSSTGRVPRILGGLFGQVDDRADDLACIRRARTSPRRAFLLRSAPWLRIRPSSPRHCRWRRRPGRGAFGSCVLLRVERGIRRPCSRRGSAPIGPMKGTPEMVSAAEAAIIATTSARSRRHTTAPGDHVDLVVEAFGEQRADRTVDQAETSVSFSVAPRSRLKKPPGMRPAAENFSW